MTLYPVPSIGLRPSGSGFVCGPASGSLRSTMPALPVYPPSPRGEALRAARIAAGLTLRHSAQLLGISAAQLSGLQEGSLVLGGEEEWDEAERVLTAGAGERGAER